MTNTLIGANLRGISDGGRLEQLAADLLTREGYEVDPTGVRGKDGGRDSFLERGGDRGILHCSAQSANIRTKINEDAENAAERPEEFAFFIFVTTTELSGTKRDNLEDAIQDEYGWRTRIWDFERLRTKLMGNPENHDLVREHLRVNPTEGFESAEVHVDELYEKGVERLSNRTPVRGNLVDEGPVIAVPVIHSESVSSPPNRIATELPDPPKFTYRSAGTQRYGDFALTAPHQEFESDEFSEYVYLDVDGWVEAVTTREVDDRYDTPAISLYLDEHVVEFLEKIVFMYEEFGISPPFYVYLSVFDAAQYHISEPKNIYIEATNPRPFGEDEIRLNRTVLESYDSDIPKALRRSFYQLWNKAGWEQGSMHYLKEDDGTFTWRPYSERDK